MDDLLVEARDRHGDGFVFVPASTAEMVTDPNETTTTLWQALDGTQILVTESHWYIDFPDMPAMHFVHFEIYVNGKRAHASRARQDRVYRDSPVMAIDTIEIVDREFNRSTLERAPLFQSWNDIPVSVVPDTDYIVESDGTSATVVMRVSA